jgi:type II secretory pathway pseudopilin PulG
MTAVSRSRSVPARQKGYALLMAMFLVATMIIMATVVTPNILTEGRREREQEAIWRGNQYARAIGLYYRKNGRYPQTVDDLVKGNLGVHFVRKAYTDPTNPADGSWRFIYVSPSGQGPQGGPGPGGGQPDAGAQATGGIGNASQQGATQPGAQGQGFAPTQGAFSSSFGSTPSAPATQPAQSAFGAPQPAADVPLQAVDGPVLGGFLIGVAGKVKRPSLIVYQGGKSYFDWEFIYNPLSVVAVGGQPAPGAPGAPPVTPPGPNGPAGTPPGFSSSPGGNAPLGLPPVTNTP